ncbi:MAG: hypothetical protein ACRCXZ_05490 [Patescibacteria group bacterium]
MFQKLVKASNRNLTKEKHLVKVQLATSLNARSIHLNALEYEICEPSDTSKENNFEIEFVFRSLKQYGSLVDFLVVVDSPRWSQATPLSSIGGKFIKHLFESIESQDSILALHLEHASFCETYVKKGSTYTKHTQINANKHFQAFR